MNTIIASKLKILRKTKNLSQEQMADYLRISQSAYARMESGESHSWANHILKICSIFKISPEDLVKIENPKDHLDFASSKAYSQKAIQEYETKIEELKREIEKLKKDKDL